MLAASKGDQLEGVFSINPPMILRDRRAPLVPAIVQWNGAMRQLGFADGHFQRSNDDTESPDINYEVDYLTGVREVRRTSEACRKRLGAVTAPALIVQSDADPLVQPNGAGTILARLGSDDKLVVELPFDRHVIVRGEHCETVFETVYQFVQRVSQLIPV